MLSEFLKPGKVSQTDFKETITPQVKDDSQDVPIRLHIKYVSRTMICLVSYVTFNFILKINYLQDTELP